jgi:NTE family protein
MGNPALFPLVDECAAGDVVVIQINPFCRPDVPRSARDIQNRLNEITFNASLLKELRALAFLWEIIHYEDLERERFRDVHVHAIHDEATMLELGVSSKLNAEWTFLTYLRDRGRSAAQRWLSAHYDDLGVRNTLDLRRRPEAGAPAGGCGARNCDQGGRPMTPGGPRRAN